MIDLEREGEVFVLRLDAGENRFSPGFVEALGARLDEVEKADAPKALVTTGSGKFYSNGLDLDYMLGAGRERAGDYLSSVLALLARVLTFPCVTVAAVNGHAFGAGALIALTHDFRLMRADRGFFCMPEIDMRAPLHPGMTAVLQARLPALVAHEVVVTGNRFGGELAAARGIVDEACPESDLLGRAIARAGGLAGKADPVMRILKEGMYPEVLEALRAPLAGVPGLAD